MKHKTQSTIVWLILLAALAWILFAPTLPYLLSEWRASQQRHCPYMVLIAVGLVVWLWRQGKLPASSFQPAPRWGALALGGSLALLTLGALADVNPVRTGAWIFVIASLVLTFCGWQVLRVVWFPIAFLVFAVPKYALIDMTTFPLQLIAAKTALVMGQLCGLDLVREGVNLTLNPGTKGQYQFTVAAACSGMNSLESLSIIGSLFIMYVFTLSTWRKIVMFALIVPIAILLNGFRIASTFLSASVFGPKAAEGFFHEWSGIIVYALELLCLVGAARGLEMIPLGQRDPQTTQPPEHVTPGLHDRKSLLIGLKGAVGLFAAAVVAIALLATPKTAPKAAPPLERVPLVLADWRGKEEPKDSPDNKQAWEILRPDAMTIRTYTRLSSSETVNVLTIVSRSHRSFHVPEFCQLGAGWNIFKNKITQISVPRRDDPSRMQRIPVHLSVAEKHVAEKPDQPPLSYRQMILYWYSVDDYITHSMKRLQIYMAMSRLFGRQVYGAHFRLTMPLMRSEKQTLRIMEEFLGSYLPQVYKAEIAAPAVLSRAQQLAQRLGTGGWLIVIALLVAPLIFTIHSLRSLPPSARGAGAVDMPIETEMPKTPAGTLER
ncbi:MAG: EpsI family protein [Abditibacteriales bacterium]|nr:EpsI family protein [Abditibacteriales bacterium]MDW8364361.1 EpsI family protein [Abditibacteriales bacterium]